jgi:predicted DCC family thiol-disulfide oxidoreductase YuxK
MTDDILVYDDDCGFCTWWADYFGRRADLELVGFGELTDDQRERLPEDFESCAHLLTDEAVYSCGAAAERVLARADVPPGADEFAQFFRQFEDYERLRERLYRELADRRELWGQLLSKDSVRRR